MTSEQRSATKSGEDQSETAELQGAEEPRGTPGVAFLIAGVVAAAYVALGLSDGGFDPGVWAQATIIVWWTVIVALVAGAWPRSGIPAAGAAAGAALLAIALLSGASMGWASDLGAAYADALRAAGYLGVFALMAVASRAGAGRAVLAGIAFGLAAIALLALLSRLEPGLVTGADEARGLRVSGGRLSYPVGYWNGLGACMAAAIPLLVWLGAGTRGTRWRPLATAALPICLLTLFFSGSRGGALATGVGLAALLVCGPRRVPLAAVAALGFAAAAPLVIFGAASDALVDGADTAAANSRGDQLLLLTIVVVAILAVVAHRAGPWIGRLHVPVVGVRAAAGAVAILAVLALLVADPLSRLERLGDAPVTTRFEGVDPTRFAEVSGSGRAQFWETAVDAFADEPLRGIGAGGFEFYWARHGSFDLPVTHAHSLWLESAAELGVGGLIMIVALVVIAILAGIRRLRSAVGWADRDTAGGAVGAALAVLAAGIVSASVEWVWEIPAALIPLIASAAYLTVAPAGAPAASRRGRRRSLITLVAVLVAGLGSIAAAGFLAVSELRLAESDDALRAGEPGRALDEARGAADALSFAAAPQRQIARIHASEGRFAEAERAIERAQERAEEDWDLWFIEGGIEFAAGNTGRGIWALNYAAELNPGAPSELLRVPTALEAGYYRRLDEGLEVAPSP